MLNRQKTCYIAPEFEIVNIFDDKDVILSSLHEGQDNDFDAGDLFGGSGW